MAVGEIGTGELRLTIPAVAGKNTLRCGNQNLFHKQDEMRLPHNAGW